MTGRGACLIIHGLDGPAETAPLVEFFQKRGLEARCPPLFPATARGGAGEVPLGRGAAGVGRWEGWLAALEEAFRQLAAAGGPVVAVGYSMGGLLGALLCARQPVGALVTINAPVRYPHGTRLAAAILRGARRPAHRPGAADRITPGAALDVARRSLPAFLEFRRLLRAARPVLSEVRQPVLIVQGLQDLVVHPRSAEDLFRRIASPRKEVRVFPRSGHGIHRDVERDAFLAALWTFVADHLAGPVSR